MSEEGRAPGRSDAPERFSWESPEMVERFAAREPDHRLGELIESYPEPAMTRVLDLACAGGRNTVFLAEKGFDVRAVDASRAMVERTRERLAPILGREEAESRVIHTPMHDLARAGDACFDLVVALGIYHCAESRAEWDRALAETTRVLRSGGRLLVSVFTPHSDLTGRGVRPVAGEPGVYEGFPRGRSVLLDAAELDTEMARHGLVPEVATETVRVETEKGRRVTANARYCLKEAQTTAGRWSTNMLECGECRK